MSNAELIDELTAQVTRQVEIIREQAFTIAQLEAVMECGEQGKMMPES